MKGKRIDNKTRAKLITKRINEDKDIKDIAKEIGINERTAQRIIKDELSDVVVKSDKVAELIDRNNELQSLADAMIASKLKSGEESIKLSELVSLRDSTFKQNQLVQGKATENIGYNGSELLLKIQTGILKKEDAYDLMRKLKDTQ